MADSLDKDVVLAEGQLYSNLDSKAPTIANITVYAAGYKQYDTGRTYMAKMGDWRDNKDEEIELDGIGGVNILVKADVHRSGMSLASVDPPSFPTDGEGC